MRMFQGWDLTMDDIGFIVVDSGANMLAAVSKYTDEHSEDADSDQADTDDDTSETADESNEQRGFLLNFVFFAISNKMCTDLNAHPTTARLKCVIHTVVRAVKIVVEDSNNNDTVLMRSALDLARTVTFFLKTTKCY